MTCPELVSEDSDQGPLCCLPITRHGDLELLCQRLASWVPCACPTGTQTHPRRLLVDGWVPGPAAGPGPYMGLRYHVFSMGGRQNDSWEEKFKRSWGQGRKQNTWLGLLPDRAVSEPTQCDLPQNILSEVEGTSGSVESASVFPSGETEAQSPTTQGHSAGWAFPSQKARAHSAISRFPPSKRGALRQ